MAEHDSGEKKTGLALGLGALGLAGGVLDFLGATRRLPGAKQDVTAAETALASSLDDIAENRYKKSLDQANLEAMMTGFRPTDLTPLQTIQAQQLENLAVGGERALMTGATNVARQNLEAQQAAQQRDFSTELMGRQAAAESTAAIDAANIQAEQRAAMLEAQMNQQALAQAQQNLAQIQADQASAIPEALGSTLGIAGAFLGSAESGGKVDLLTQMLEMGGKPVVQKLDGPEDHDKKKFAIMESGAVIDEDNGKKVAEATGQEYILNSEQAGGIHDEYDVITEKIKSGKKLTNEDWMVFYNAVDKVFSQPQFNEDVA
tara:strand:- start:370 stop:1323 length:954 start_codon:yes stop_codon:yes gene_type:complete